MFYVQYNSSEWGLVGYYTRSAIRGTSSPVEVTVHNCANIKFLVAKSNKFDYYDEKTCIFQIFFVILQAKLQINEQYNNSNFTFIAQLGGTERVDARHLEP